MHPNVAASGPRLEPLLQTALVTGRRRSTRECFTTACRRPGRVWKGPTANIAVDGVPTTTDSSYAEGKAPPPLIPRASLQELRPASCLARVRSGMGAPHTRMITRLYAQPRGQQVALRTITITIMNVGRGSLTPQRIIGHQICTPLFTPNSFHTIFFMVEVLTWITNACHICLR